MRSYRDTVRLFLGFVAADKGCRITALGLDDLSFERVLAFLKHLEADRGNHIATRNQRLAAMHCLFEYVASRSPEHLGVCQRVAAIPRKRVAPPQTHFLEKDEVEMLLRGLPRAGRHALRDRARARSDHRANLATHSAATPPSFHQEGPGGTSIPVVSSSRRTSAAR